jgi:hypothetical protein
VSFETSVAELNNVGEYLGAPFIVALFYWFRFHTRKGTRSYTTFLLYCIGIVVFVLPFLMAYFAISQLFKDELSASSAICLTMLIWLVPGPPGWWRNFCQSLARIPDHAHGMQTRLCTAAWELPPADWPGISRKLARIGYQVEDLRAIQSAPIQSRFLKIAALMHHLEEWKLTDSAFFERNSEHYSNLLAIYDLLSFKAVRVLKNTGAIYGAIMENSKVQPDDWHALDSLSTRNDSGNRLQSIAQNAAGGMLEDLRKDMDFLLDHLLLLTARCVLSSEWTFAGRKRRLEEVGFTLAPPGSGIMWMTLAAIGLTLVTVLTWFGTMKNPSDMIAGIQAVGVTRSFVMSPLNVIASLLIVYHLKRNYAFANEGVFGGLPFRFILSIGGLVALVMFPVQAVFDYYQFSKDPNYADMDYATLVAHELPVLSYMWVTGSVVALLVQDSMWRGFGSPRMMRIMDGVVFGAAWLFAVALLFAINRGFSIPIMKNMAEADFATFCLIFGFTFVAGFVLGFFLIADFRHAGSLRAARDELTASGALAHAS